MLQVEKLVTEVEQHYPDEPVNAMRYLMETYELNDMSATHLVIKIWNHLHMKYTLNLPTFLINPYAIFKN